MSTPPLIDRAVLDDLFASLDDDGARTVLALFADESRGYLATIAAAGAAPGDAAVLDKARRAAHSLKSGAGQIGAAAIAATAAAVEHAAAANAPELAQAIASLERCAAETIAALAPLLPR